MTTDNDIYRIHGWNAGPGTGANNGVARVLLDHDDFNYIYLGMFVYVVKHKQFFLIHSFEQTGQLELKREQII